MSVFDKIFFLYIFSWNFLSFLFLIEHMWPSSVRTKLNQKGTMHNNTFYNAISSKPILKFYKFDFTGTSKCWNSFRCFSLASSYTRIKTGKQEIKSFLHVQTRGCLTHILGYELFPWFKNLLWLLNVDR